MTWWLKQRCQNPLLVVFVVNESRQLATKATSHLCIVVWTKSIYVKIGDRSSFEKSTLEISLKQNINTKEKPIGIWYKNIEVDLLVYLFVIFII